MNVSTCSGLNGAPPHKGGDLFGKRVFEDVIKVRIVRCDHPGLLRQALNPMSSVLTTRQKKTDTQRRKVTRRQAETGVIQL
jgi:hypothetical protein